MSVEKKYIEYIDILDQTILCDIFNNTSKSGKYPAICLTPSLEAYPNCLCEYASTTTPQAYMKPDRDPRIIANIRQKLLFHSYLTIVTE